MLINAQIRNGECWFIDQFLAEECKRQSRVVHMDVQVPCCNSLQCGCRGDELEAEAEVQRVLSIPFCELLLSEKSKNVCRWWNVGRLHDMASKLLTFMCQYSESLKFESLISWGLYSLLSHTSYLTYQDSRHRQITPPGEMLFLSHLNLSWM